MSNFISLVTVILSVFLNYKRAKETKGSLTLGVILGLFLNLLGVAIFYFITRSRQTAAVSSGSIATEADTVLLKAKSKKKRLAMVLFLILILLGIVIGLLVTTFDSLGVIGGTKTAQISVDASSNVCWSGSFVDATHDGCGTTSIQVDSDIAIFAAVVQKKSPGSGTLTISLIVDGKVIDTATTTSEYGVVTVSGHG